MADHTPADITACERFRLLVEGWAQAVWEADAEGRIVADSPSWRTHTGQSLEECLGQGWLDAVHPDDRAHAARQWREAVAAGRNLDAEFRLRHAASHGWRWTHVRAAPLRDAEGRVRKWVGMNVDIDARVRAQQAIRDSEAKYRALFDSVDEGFCIIEVLFDAAGQPEDYRFHEVNGAFERHTGLRNATGRRARELKPTLDAHWFDIYGRIARGGGPERFVDHAEALGRWFDVYAFRIGDPEAHRVAVLFRDITAHQSAQDALRESETRFRALVTASSHLMYRMSADWRQMYALDGQGLLADTRAPIADWADLYILPEDRATVFAAIGEAIRRRALFELEHRVRRADGSIGWVLSRAAPILGPDGEVIEWFGAGTDVSDRRLAEERLRDSEARHRAELERQVRERTAELQASRDLLQATMDSSIDMIQVFAAIRDEAGAIVDFRWLLNNHAAERRYGNVRGESLLERNPGVVQEGIFDTFRRVVATGEPDIGERRYIHEQFDGWFFQSVVKLGDGVATTTKDITAWKAAQEEVLRLRDEVAQARLRESEDRLAMALQAARMGTFTWTSNGSRPILSDMSREVFGLLPGTVFATSREGLDLVHPEDRARHQAIFERASQDGEDYHSIFRIIRPRDGKVAWIEEQGRASRDAQTGATIIRGVHWDVTAREEALRALRESETRFRGFAENSADVLWITNRDATGLAYLSPAFERVFGEPRERILQDFGRFCELLHPGDTAAVAGFLPRALAGETVIAQYRVIRQADGRVVHLRDTGFPIRDAAGAVACVAGIAQDVTDLHAAAAAKEAEKERFRTLAEGIPQLVWRSRPGGEWSWASPQWKARTGQDEAESSGRGWLDAVHPADQDAALAAWAEAEGAGIYQADFRLRHAASGNYAWFQTRGVPLRDAAGTILEWIGACANIDDQVRARQALARSAEELERRVQERTAELLAAEATLRQAQKMEAIGQLTGGIAHDFNNMLQGVMGGLDMARRRLAEGRTADVTRYMQAARDAAARAAGLTRRLLAFARRQPIDPRPVDPDALVGGMSDLLRRTMGPGVTIEFRLRDGAGHVLCDASELESAVLNLCINARDAMPQGGRLTIATQDIRLAAADIGAHEEAEPGEFVAIRIEDTGTGMAPEVLERVLEPFFTTKQQGEGTGLGLSQVYGFARQSGGALRIESAPGRGTCVRILLPRTAAAGAMAEPHPAPEAAERPGRGETVLMVDDETAVRGPAAERLRDLGYNVVEADDGPSALRLLDEGLRPGVLVTDVGLPNGMDGRLVAEEAQRRLPGLPVVFVTGYARVLLPEDALVVTKPFDLDMLARRIGAVRQGHW